MANPVYPVNVVKDGWRKVATSVVTGTIYKMKTDTTYLQTYRLTGEAAPTLRTEGVRLFQEFPDMERISSPAPIDVYVWCDNEDGILRVDV